MALTNSTFRYHTCAQIVSLKTQQILKSLCSANFNSATKRYLSDEAFDKCYDWSGFVRRWISHYGSTIFVSRHSASFNQMIPWKWKIQFDWSVCFEYASISLTVHTFPEFVGDIQTLGTLVIFVDQLLWVLCHIFDCSINDGCNRFSAFRNY